MPLALLHTFSAEQTTTTVAFATARFALHIELQRGWVHGLAILGEPPGVDHPPKDAGELAARERALLAAIAPGLPPHADAPSRLLALLVEGLRAGMAPAPLVEPSASPPGHSSLRRAGLSPFHPLPVLRATIAQLLVGGGADRGAQVDALLAAMTRPRLALRRPLHPSGLDPDEQVAAQLLASSSHWDELLLRSRCARPRLLRLLRDAAVLGALDADDAEVLPQRLLGVLLARDGAVLDEHDEASRRRSYHAQARAVHPDLHPDADEDERAARTRAMAELAARRRRDG